MKVLVQAGAVVNKETTIDKSPNEGRSKCEHSEFLTLYVLLTFYANCNFLLYEGLGPYECFSAQINCTNSSSVN